MAPLIPFLSSSPYSSSHLPPKPQPPVTPLAPTPATIAAHPSWLCLLLARATARHDPEPSTALVEAPPEPVVPMVEERRPLAVRTGELFLGLAALLLLRGTEATRGEGGAAVEEVEAKDEVVWEQRPEDVEAEWRRRELTSPELSFSATRLTWG